MERHCQACGKLILPGKSYKTVPTRHKECHRLSMAQRSRAKPEVQEYDRERAKRPGRRAKNRETVIRWRRDNPVAYRAQTAVGNAIRDGKLKKKPCEVCGNQKVHAHHDDYAKPLDVRWLCALHHHRLHADDPSAEGANKKEIACSRS